MEYPISESDFEATASEVEAELRGPPSKKPKVYRSLLANYSIAILVGIIMAGYR